MEDIVISTVYGSYNHGSFLQAYHLGQNLKDYGNPIYLNGHTREWSLLLTALRRAKMFVSYTRNPTKILKIIGYEIIEAIKIKCAWRRLSSVEVVKPNDKVVLGSDEIWNVTRPECRYDIFWGRGLDNEKVSYATSVNNADVDDFEKYPAYIEQLNRLKQISVRDQQSKHVLSNYTDKEIHVVLDPTLLNKPEIIPFNFAKPYIAVYTFHGHISVPMQKKIIRYARENGLELVATGQHVQWCDRCVHSINGNPFYVYQNAEFVITSTFHGTAFAINHGAQFAVCASGNRKVEELLAQFNLQNRMMKEDSSVEDYVSERINYDSVNRILDELRSVSREYLKDCMKN